MANLETSVSMDLRDSIFRCALLNDTNEIFENISQLEVLEWKVQKVSYVSVQTISEEWWLE